MTIWYRSESEKPHVGQSLHSANPAKDPAVVEKVLRWAISHYDSRWGEGVIKHELTLLADAVRDGKVKP